MCDVFLQGRNVFFLRLLQQGKDISSISHVAGEVPYSCAWNRYLSFFQ